MSNIVDDAGIANASVEVKKVPFTFPSIQALLNNIRSWMPYFSPVTDGRDLDAFLQLVGENYLAKVPANAEGGVFLESHLLEVVASPSLSPQPTLV